MGWRTSGRISLTSNPCSHDTLMRIPSTRHCQAATAAMTRLWDSQRWHPIKTQTRFVMNENGRCIRLPILVLPQKSLRPPHERFRPDAPMLLEHACIPRILKPCEVVPLCRGQALAEAGESIQDFPSAPLRSDSTPAFAARAQVCLLYTSDAADE